MLSETQSEILRVIASQGAVPRALLSEHLRLSQAAVSGICKDLIKNNYIKEVSTRHGTGRPAKLLGLSPEGAYFIGISLTPTPPQLLLCDFSGQVLSKKTLTLCETPQEFAQHIADKVSEVSAENNISVQKISAIGVTLSGLIDAQQKICVKSTILGWQDVPLAAHIEAATGLSCIIENDAKSLALHAKIFGAARSAESLSVIWLGAGIGAAHWVNGQILRGAHGGGGEIAHATVAPGGLPCRCGKIGCLDTVASLTALLAEAKSEGLDAPTPSALEALAAQGNPAAIRILHHAGAALGYTLAQIVQFNDPAQIILFHSAYRSEALLFTVLQQTLEQNVLPSLSGHTPLTITHITDDFWAHAAASVATYAYLQS